MTTRFFVALLPPKPLQETVDAIKQEFADRYHSRGAQLSPPHITLQPPFVWTIEMITKVKTCLQEVADQHSPNLVTLDGFQSFPPRVIYIHVNPTPWLTTLQTHVADVMKVSLGIVDAQAQRRAFVPHMTVAFRDLTKPNFVAAWAEFRDRPFQQTFLATHLTLLHHNGKCWHPFAAFPFSSPSDANP